jgi:hypothetical protein
MELAKHLTIFVREISLVARFIYLSFNVLLLECYLSTECPSLGNREFPWINFR